MWTADVHSFGGAYFIQGWRRKADLLLRNAFACRSRMTSGCDAFPWQYNRTQLKHAFEKKDMSIGIGLFHEPWTSGTRAWASATLASSHFLSREGADIQVAPASRAYPSLTLLLSSGLRVILAQKCKIMTLDRAQGLRGLPAARVAY